MAPRVLAVDDNFLSFTLLAEALREAGHEVRFFSDPRKALKAFQTGKFNLVVTDRQMPGMDGEALAKEIWKIEPDIPIILMTGGGMEEREAKDRGFKGLLKKPCPSKYLLRMIEELFPST